MKILLVQDFLRSGGTERQTILLANAFAAAGHPTSLLTFRPGGPLAHTLSPAVTHRALQPFDTRLDWFAPGLRRAVRRASPDIVLCMGRMANCHGEQIANTLSRLHLRQRANECAAEIKEPTTPASLGTMRTGKPLPLLARRALGRVTHIIANSEAARTTLQTRYSVPPERISVIPNALVFPPLPHAEAAPARAALRSEHGADDTTTVLLDCAMFRPEKNQRELIEIAAQLPATLHWQLWLAGDGPALADCRARATQLGLADRVHFLGFVADPRPLYAAADLAVHASKSESLCNFLLEAQAAGLPSIAARAQGIEECLTRPGETGLVIEHGDRDGFRRAILHFAQAGFRKTPTTQTADPAAAYLALFQKLLTGH
ncbi:hypothetical protein AXK12_03385 [Cephaloticoccus capnophilus]|uniref:Glycosyltransferase subfamily 4-like N-terminal domain-containing protein n=1 Tax=Cephaloticoccus capnophilus TaxID=1548208 RepID=A0A139SPG1_9BACT|nr:glycosyltransferase [Cephaloticoccus capnophilus]KXU36341.1 hypothetical protein AXK12_03385 [Cephaloticoccus capnophilus]